MEGNTYWLVGGFVASKVAHVIIAYGGVFSPGDFFSRECSNVPNKVAWTAGERVEVQPQELEYSFCLLLGPVGFLLSNPEPLGTWFQVISPCLCVLESSCGDNPGAQVPVCLASSCLSPVS